jgi:hypothetical protein
MTIDPETRGEETTKKESSQRNTRKEFGGGNYERS